MTPIVLDLETTVRNKGEDAVGSFSGSPFSRKNFIVVVAEHSKGRSRLDYGVVAGEVQPPKALSLAAEGKEVLLIGHNLGFDLLYVMKTWPELWAKARPTLYIWDTQQVEYLLFGQSEMYPSLDDASARRGLPLKDDRIKRYWNDGMDTTEIPKDELLEYAEGDVVNTWWVFKDQYRELQDDPLLMELVRVKMDDLLLTIHMQYYGMAFDLVVADQKIQELDKELEGLYNSIKEQAQSFMPEDVEFNPDSPAHLSAVLFGGVIKTERPVAVRDDQGQVVLFKSGERKGQEKTKLTKMEIPIKGMGLPIKGIAATTHGFSTADAVLEKLKDKAPLAGLIAKHRALSKDVSTYYQGYSALVWADGNIHPNINHESTVTGRQSVSAPNLQNVSKEEED